MKRISLLLISAVLSLSLPGCAERWEKPGATEQESESAKETCTNMATAKFPPDLRLEEETRDYLPPRTATCNRSGGSVHCFSTGGQQVSPTVVAVDDNLEARNQEIRSCLFEKGWQPVKD